MDEILSGIYEAILEGDATKVMANVQAALDAKIPAETILNAATISSMEEVGKRFEEGELFVPEMLISARAMKAGLSLLKPYLVEGNVKTAGKIVIGTVHGDLHDIGKNLVSVMLEGSGFEIIDLGTDVTPEKFVETVKTQQPDVVALSALLTTTMSNMGNIIKALETGGLRDQVKVIVGGAPVTQNFASSIGADGFAPDASQAVTLVKSLL